jgi:lipopolysaccharide biosynthesis glycosyltransferase
MAEWKSRIVDEVMAMSASSAKRNEIAVVTAADNAYAIPLAVTIRSAIDYLAADRSLVVYVLDGGLSPDSKQRLSRSWRSPHVSIQWLQPPMEQIADLKTEYHLNHVTYLRLFMPALLANHAKVIFLDADLLVQKDLSALWDVELDGAPVAAVHDYFAPFLDTRQAIGRTSICDRYPDKRHPIPNYRELGLDPTAAYFNAGVMVVDLNKWREMDVFGRALDLTRRYVEDVRYCDQYALNVLFSQRWKALDPRWNQGSNLFAWNGASDGGFDPKLYSTLRNDPWIVHFTWNRKPWQYGCTHPYTRRFFRVLDRTDWRGWRSDAPASLRARFDNAYRQYRAWYRNHISPFARALKEKISGKRAA